MSRQIVLDTETTGLSVQSGHRLIEIGCVELVDRFRTQNDFHIYINPEREIDSGAVAVHGITLDFLKDKPLFADIADQLLAYLEGAELIIHNAPFDLGFLNHELKRLKRGIKPLEQSCTVFDTLVFARKKHAAQRNSLDALCKRYGIDNSNRHWHGALKDANLLADVFLAMTRSQANFSDILTHPETSSSREAFLLSASNESHQKQRYRLKVQRATREEVALHEALLDELSNASR